MRTVRVTLIIWVKVLHVLLYNVLENKFKKWNLYHCYERSYEMGQMYPYGRQVNHGTYVYHMAVAYNKCIQSRF